MPSVLLGFLSGGTNILSGNYFSGQGAFRPIGGVQLIAHPNNSGIIYVALSGGAQSGASSAISILSGTFQQSGAFASGLGVMDGMPLAAGIPYFVDKAAFPGTQSGFPQIFCQPDANCSGQGRIHFEVF